MLISVQFYVNFGAFIRRMYSKPNYIMKSWHEIIIIPQHTQGLKEENNSEPEKLSPGENVYNIVYIEYEFKTAAWDLSPACDWASRNLLMQLHRPTTTAQTPDDVTGVTWQRSFGFIFVHWKDVETCRASFCQWCEHNQYIKVNHWPKETNGRYRPNP